MTPEEFRNAGHQVIDWVADFRAGVNQLPVMAQVGPGAVKAKLPQAPPQEPESFQAILADLDYTGSDVALLVNGLGATPYEELYVIYRRVKQILDGRRIKIRRPYVGEYVTSLEMAGCSVTVSAVDAAMLALWDTPLHTPALRWGM